MSGKILRSSGVSLQSLIECIGKLVKLRDLSNAEIERILVNCLHHGVGKCLRVSISSC